VERTKQAVILAAGEGERLRPFTALKPKVMIPVANKPILQYVVEALVLNGIRNIVMVVGYRKEQVLDFFGSGEQFDVDIGYAFQEQQLGTAHALKQAEDVVEDRFLVLSGDNIIEADTLASFTQAKANTVFIKEQENVSKYGVVIVRNGMVEAIEEKPKEARGNLVNTGIYVFNREIFEFIEEEVDLTSAIGSMIARGSSVAAQMTGGSWLDVVYPWDILKLNDVALRTIPSTLAGSIERGVTLKGLVSVGRDTVIRSNTYIVGPVVIGENCEIGPSVSILPATSIGNNTVVSSFTQIENSVIGNNVQIGPSSTIEDSIIDRGSTLKGHLIARSGEVEVKINGEYHRVEIGAMLGEYCHLEGSVIVHPGVIVGNHSQVKALRVLEENIPDGSLVV
jgi:glucose-1-phosphate thymidylyltransferase